MISEQDQELLRRRFAQDLRSRVRIDLFTQKPSPIIIPGRAECRFCGEAETLLTELASLNDRLSLTVHDFHTDEKASEALGVDGVPGTVLRGASNRPMRYFGMPTGSFFPAFIETIVETSRGTNELQPETTAKLKKIRDDVMLQVLVTPSCEHSPAVARTAFRLAQQSNKVKVDVIEILEFPTFIEHYGIQVTPTVILNETLVLAGAMDEATLVDCLLKAVEGKEITNPEPWGPRTPLPRAQDQEVRTAGSGLIIPR